MAGKDGDVVYNVDAHYDREDVGDIGGLQEGYNIVAHVAGALSLL